MGAQDDDDDGDAIAPNPHQTCPQCEVERWPWVWVGFKNAEQKFNHRQWEQNARGPSFVRPCPGSGLKPGQSQSRMIAKKKRNDSFASKEFSCASPENDNSSSSTAG